ncbi:efflux RND transporter permease subunit [Photorhabdus akhurstii]|uniref:efflux RND transporter permease subunit n=1 Tax=Photorhabdus akhurstii TaxID=171438 RepID=UPI001BD30E20|nr:efflux RND transporter permease subunit [Photorhabdus akhurstii]MBS9430163.1 efflux RND transporter permease subunit [Photorhabdus akhurstii]
MKIIGLFLRRPIIVTTFSGLLFIAGLFSIGYLPVGLYPSVDADAISVSTFYPGASADLIDGRITSEVLSAISGIDDINYVTSTSETGSSKVVLHLAIGSDTQKVLTNIMERVNTISHFPDDMEPPQISRQETERIPDFALSFTSETMQAAQVSDFLHRVVKPRLESLKGVGNVEILGSEYAMRIWLDPERMERHGVTTIDISKSLKLENAQANGGALHDSKLRFQLVPETGLSTIGDFANLSIMTATNISPVRLKDVADIELGGSQPEIKSIFNGKPATIVLINWQQGSNPLLAADDIYKTIGELKSSFPYDLQSNVLIDSSEYIGGAVHEVFITILLTCCAVTLVIFLGAGTLRAVVIPVIAIPLSLIGVCLIIHLCGFSINTLTLLAMVLATGLVVDDAIIVLDIALHRMRMGDTPYQAALKGGNEIATSLVTMTLTLAIVYLPLAFIGGIVGKLFSEFAVTLAGAVIISGILALSLTPVMCARMLSTNHQHSLMVIRVEKIFTRFRRSYERVLIRIMKTGNFPLWLWGTTLAGVTILFIILPHALAPKEDQGSLMVIAEGPSVIGTDYIEQHTPILENIYSTLPEIANFNYVIGVPKDNQLLSFVRLINWSERQRSTIQLQPELQNIVAKIPALQSVVILPSSLPGVGGLPFQFVLKHEDKDYANLDALSDLMLREMRASGMFLFLKKDLKYDTPQIHIRLDREQLAKVGVSASDVGYSMNLAYANTKLQPFIYEGRTYSVIMALKKTERAAIQSLLDLQVRSIDGNLIRLGSLVTQNPEVGPESLNTFQKQAAVTLQGVLAPGIGQSEATEFARQLLHNLKPQGVSYDLSGETRQSKEEGQRLLVTFAIALVGIYCLLALQLTNYLGPLIVLLGSIPFSVLGALLALSWFDVPLDMFTQVGMLTLVGLISKQGILMVQATDNLHKKGSISIYYATVRASASRLRAIVLTTLTMILGALPLLFASGPAAESRFELGLVIIMGMLVGSCLTLFLLPSLYIFVHKKTTGATS